MRQPAETLEIMLRRLAAQKVVCLDLETSGLDFNRNHIVGHVVTFGPRAEDSYYLPVRHAGAANLGGESGPSAPMAWRGDMTDGERALVRALDEPGRFLFGHNVGFDLRFLARCGFGFNPQCEDTIVNAALLDEFQPSFKLEYCAELAKVEAKKTVLINQYIIDKFKLDPKQAKEPMAHFWRLAGNDPIAHEYAAGDGVTTWQLRDWQHVEIAREVRDPKGRLIIPSLKRVHAVECRLVRVLARMTATGVKINVPRLEQLRKTVVAKIEELMGAFPSDFNPRGPAHVRKYLESHNVTGWPMTAPSKRFEHGQPSFPEEWLVKTEPGRAIVKARHYLTLRSMFIEPLLNEHLFKGRVHTTFNQLRGDEYGTVTGRLSSSRPNMQAIPKRDKEIGKLFRAVFVPDPGKIWFSSDYSQLEPRLLAIYSGAKSLLAGYRATPPIDAHTTVTLNARLFQPNGKPDRDMGKRCNMLIINGGGAPAMVRKFNMELQHAYKTLDMYFEGTPEIRDLQKAAQRKYGQRGYVLTLLDRKIRLRQRSHDYMAVNRILQGGNADIIKLKMVEVDDYLESEGRPLDMLLTIHDAIDGQLDPANKRHVDEIIRIMQDFGPGREIEISGLPIVVNYAYGDNWGDATWDEDD